MKSNMMLTVREGHYDRDAKVRKSDFFGYVKIFSIFTLKILAHVNCR